MELIPSGFMMYIIGMNKRNRVLRRLSIISELGQFLRYRKRYWLLPILIFLILLSLFIVLAEGSAVAPFIYTLF